MGVSALASIQHASQINSAPYKKVNSTAHPQNGKDKVSFSDEAMALSASHEASRAASKNTSKLPEHAEKTVGNEKAPIDSESVNKAKVHDDSEERLLFSRV